MVIGSPSLDRLLFLLFATSHPLLRFDEDFAEQLGTVTTFHFYIAPARRRLKFHLVVYEVVRWFDVAISGRAKATSVSIQHHQILFIVFFRVPLSFKSIPYCSANSFVVFHVVETTLDIGDFNKDHSHFRLLIPILVARVSAWAATLRLHRRGGNHRLIDVDLPFPLNDLVELLAARVISLSTATDNAIFPDKRASRPTDCRVVKASRCLTYVGLVSTASKVFPHRSCRRD